MTQQMIGRVRELRRFPVKSMAGEMPRSVEVVDTGIRGDRAHALVDVETGAVASAKRPSLWGGLLDLRAEYVDEPAAGAPLVVTLPDGTAIRSDDRGFDARLSDAVGRPVRLEAVAAPGASYEDEWPDVDGLAPDEFVEATRTATSEAGLAVSSLPVGLMAQGTFQDVSPITVLTSASLGDWDPLRFRMNLLIDVDGDGFVENGWVGRRLVIGTLALDVIAPTPRCVMTTLAQGSLPQDRTVLQEIARENRQEVAGTGVFACLGAYAIVAASGRVTVGDDVLTD